MSRDLLDMGVELPDGETFPTLREAHRVSQQRLKSLYDPKDMAKLRYKVDPLISELATAHANGPEAEAKALNSLNRKGRRKLLSLIRKGHRHAAR